MKSFLQLLFLIISSSLLSAQGIMNHIPDEIKDELTQSNYEPPSIPDISAALRLGNPKKQLDSMVESAVLPNLNNYTNDTKEEYEYDAAFNATKFNYYTRDNNSLPWNRSSTREYSYDNSNNLIERTNWSSWSDSLGVFINGTREEFSYSNNLITENVYSNFNNSTQLWELDVKKTSTYNAQEKLTERIHSIYNQTSQTWEFDKKELWTYNSLGDLSEQLTQLWVSGQWENQEKKVHTYNSNDLISLIEEFSFVGGIWENSEKSEYLYNINNDLTTVLTRTFAGGYWQNNSKTETTYLSNGLGRDFERFNWLNNSWDPSSKTETRFDQLDNITEWGYYSNWEDNSQSWRSGYRIRFTYDTAYAHTDLVTIYDAFYYRHQLLTYTVEIKTIANPQFDLSWSADYYWSNLANTANESLEFEHAAHTVFPNPTSNYLNFDLPKSVEPATVELYNASGQRVQTSILTDNTLQLRELPTGFYSYLVRQDGKAFSGKVVIE